jgi:hypothetical protein
LLFRANERHFKLVQATKKGKRPACCRFGRLLTTAGSLFAYIYAVKKSVAIFFLLVYGFTSVGASIHIHYCMGHYTGWNLWHSNNSKCGKCGMNEDAKKKGCCKDEHKEIKLKTEHQKASLADFAGMASAPAVIVNSPDYDYGFRQYTAPAFSNFHPPPLLQNRHLYVLFGVFLI